MEKNYNKKYYELHREAIREKATQKRLARTPEQKEKDSIMRKVYDARRLEPKIPRNKYFLTEQQLERRRKICTKWREKNREKIREEGKKSYWDNHDHSLELSRRKREKKIAIRYMNIIGLKESSPNEKEEAKPPKIYKKKKTTATQRRIDQRIKLNRAIDIKADLFRQKLALEAEAKNTSSLSPSE